MIALANVNIDDVVLSLQYSCFQSSLSALSDRLGDGCHWLGSSTLLSATAAPSLLLRLLGLLLDVERRQDGECLSHGRHPRWCRSFREAGDIVVVAILTEKIGIADVGSRRVPVLQSPAHRP